MTIAFEAYSQLTTKSFLENKNYSIQSNNTTNLLNSLESLEEEEVLETGTASFTDSEGNFVTWSQGYVTTGGDDKKYVEVLEWDINS